MCTYRTLSPAPDIHNTIFVTTVLADVIAPCNARPSTATLMTTKLYMFSGKFLRMSVISNRVCWQADVIQTGPRNLEKSHGASRVTALQTGNITFSAVNMTIRNLKHTKNPTHYNDVIMSVITSQLISLTIVYSTVYSGADQRKHQSSASLAFVWWIHRWPVNSLHKWPVTRKMFPFDDVIMGSRLYPISLPWYVERMQRINCVITT